MNQEKRQTNIRVLRGYLSNMPVAMLTTLQPRDGSLHSRPMMAQASEFDGELCFFSKFNSPKVDEIRAGSQVNLTYIDQGAGRYISISGVATIDKNPQVLQSNWNDQYKSWFPRGLEEPDLALLKVEVHTAEIWDAGMRPSGEILQFA